jgi:hypothetical protein
MVAAVGATDRLSFSLAVEAETHRVLVIPLVAARPVYVFISFTFVPTNTMRCSFDDDYSFGIIQSVPALGVDEGQGWQGRRRSATPTRSGRHSLAPGSRRETAVASVAAAGVSSATRARL